MATDTIVFIHGMYMNPLSWEHWIEYFRSRGFQCLAPAWPGRDQSVEELRTHPDMHLGKLKLDDVLDHYKEVIESLPAKPIIIGHSMGGLVVQLLLQTDLVAAGVAIDSAPPMGVLTAKWPFLKSNWPHITPFVSQNHPIQMTFPRFQYTFVNGMTLEEQRQAFDRYVVAESRRVPRQSLTARVDFSKPHPPLLMIAGSADHLIPASLNRTNFTRYRSSTSVIVYKEFAGRTHFIVGQKGWDEVAGFIYNWIKDQNLSSVASIE